MKEKEYYGARICVQKKYDDKDIDVKIFPDKDDCSFTRSRFSKKAYQDILSEIKKGNFNLEN